VHGDVEATPVLGSHAEYAAGAGELNGVIGNGESFPLAAKLFCTLLEP
jgi:hypothetical protein